MIMTFAKYGEEWMKNNARNADNVEGTFEVFNDFPLCDNPETKVRHGRQLPHLAL